MKPEKISDTCYRVRKTYNKKRYEVTFDHKPTDREAIEAMGEIMKSCDPTIKGSVKEYCLRYIENRSAVLSPSSIHTYNRLVRSISDTFGNLRIGLVTQADIQAETNLYATNHSPKSTRSYHGFISSVLKHYRPNMIISTTLPQKEHIDRYLPTEEDIKRIIDASKGSEFSIGFQLGVLSCRRSEIAALTLDDLNGNQLSITKNLVYDGKWVVKHSPKTDASNRVIYLPDSLVQEIKEKGYIFKYTPPKLNEALHRYQNRLKIPRFRFHDLRHYFASYASTIMSEADVMALGGWESDFIFKKVYRESMKEKREKSAVELASKLLR